MITTPSRSILAYLAAATFWCAVLPPCDAVAGAWTQPVGKTYLRTSIQGYEAREYFTEEGHVADGDWWSEETRFSIVSIHQVIEYGLEEDLTLVFDGVFKSLTADRPQGGSGDDPVNDLRDDRVLGLGDLGAGVRYRIRNKAVIVSLQGRIELPGGYNGDRLDYALGSGEVNLEGRLQLGGSLGIGRSNYWATEGGYRVRGGVFKDDWVYSAAIGVELLTRVWGRVGFSGVENRGELIRSDAADGAGLEDDPTRTASYTSAGAALTLVVTPRMSIETGLSGELAGENTFRGIGWDLTLEFRR